jgi:hypothetical protein
MYVGVNNPFKDDIWNSYDAIYIHTDFDRKSLREDVSQWVKASLDGVKQQQIINTCQQIGLRDDDVERDGTITTTTTTAISFTNEALRGIDF